MNAASLITAETGIVLLLLLLVCMAYAALVRYIRNEGEQSYTAILVVFGNLIVAIGASVIVGIATDSATGMIVFAVIFATNAAAGFPMVAEYTHWYMTDGKKRKRAAQHKHIADTLRGE